MTQRSTSLSPSDSADAKVTPPSQWTPKQVVVATLVVLGVGLCFVLLWRFYAVVFSFIVAIMLHVAIKPAVVRLRQRGIRREAGILLVYLIAFALLGGFIALIVPFVAQQLGAITTRLPVYYEGFREAVQSVGSPLASSVVSALPRDLSSLMLPSAPSASADEVLSPLQAISPMGYAAFVFIAIFIMAFYWTLDGERIVYTLLLRVRAERREEVRALIEEMEAKVGAFYRGQLLLCAFVGVFSLIAYLIIGLPYALLLALLAFIFEAVPMIGPALGAIPAVLVALTVSPDKAIWVIVATIVIQQIENNLLIPRVMDRTVGVSAIASILAIAAFTAIFGLVGALLAIPLVAILQIILGRVLFERQVAPGTSVAVSEPSEELAAELQSIGGRDRVAVLRLEARELAEDVRKQMRKRDRAAAPDRERVEATEAMEAMEDVIESLALDIDAWLAQRTATKVNEGMHAADGEAGDEAQPSQSAQPAIKPELTP